MSEQLFRHWSVQAGDEAVIINVTEDGPCEGLSMLVILQVCIFSVTVEGPCERLSLLFTLQVCIFYLFVSSFVLFVFFLLSSGSPYLEAFLSLKRRSHKLALVFFKVSMEISRFSCEWLFAVYVFLGLVEDWVSSFTAQWLICFQIWKSWYWVISQFKSACPIIITMEKFWMLNTCFQPACLNLQRCTFGAG